MAESGVHDVRVMVATAYRVHVARLAAGRDDEPSEEADAGALLDAHDAHAARDLRDLVEALIKGLSAQGS